MNKKILFPIFFLVIYLSVALVFAVSLFVNDVDFLNVFAIVVSLAMAYLKIRQIVDIKKNRETD